MNKLNEQVFILAQKLYFDLPFWKRWQIKKYYLSNMWDVTGEWEKCWEAAYRMLVGLEYWTRKRESVK